jgi:rubrerythrin
MNETNALAELADDPGSRKAFMRKAGAGAAGGLALLIAACGSKSSSSSSSTPSKATPAATAGSASGDLAILNYALTLEYLEADFYKQVAQSGMAKGNIAELVKAIGQTEQDHVDALTKTITSLGGKPVAKPQTKFGPVLDKGLKTVLETAATVENLGAAAYLGQAPKIKNKDVLAAALSIHSVEARHAAGLNMLVGRGFTGGSALEGSIPDGAFGAPLEMDKVLAAVKPYIA